MGSGSSKAGTQTVSKTQSSNPPKPVANDAIVNKKETESVDSEKKETTTVRNNVNERFGSRSPIKPIEPNKNDSKTDDRDGKKDKKGKTWFKKADSNGGMQNSPSGLLFAEDSDVDNDIDEVLRIPMPVDNSRQSRDREKKNKKDKGKKKDKENFDQQEQQDYNRNNRNLSTERGDEQLPETYAQRLQRQQYKLQQNMLLREKTIVRNSQDWQIESEDDEDDMKIESSYTGFDASKFRAANKGGDIKKEIFTTVPDDLQTPRYMHSTGQDLKDVDVNKREDVSPNRALPSYNQSELDLMRQLEEEIL